MDNEKNIKVLMMHSFLLSRGYQCEEFTKEDIKNMQNPETINCQIALYLIVIRMLSNGKSYEEIIEFVDNYSTDEYENLEEGQKTYIKSKTKKDLMRRKMSFEKGEDINE